MFLIFAMDYYSRPYYMIMFENNKKTALSVP